MRDPVVYQRLLQDGAVFEEPSDEITTAAAQLEQLRLIDVGRWDFVLCANPRDADFALSRPRDCPGRIRLREGCDDYHCLECDGLVFPSDPPKHRYQGLQVRIRADGILDYLAGLASAFGEHSSPGRGVLRFRADPDDVLICVAELCRDVYYLRRDTAAVRPTVLVTLEPAGAHLVLREDWLLSTTLAEVVAEEVSLSGLVRRAASQGIAEIHTSTSLPIYTAGIRAVAPKPSHGSSSVLRLELEVTADGARVQGITVADRRADIQLSIMQILWDELRRWFSEGHSEELEPLRLSRIADQLERRTQGERPDLETVRKAINRLQAKIERRLKQRLGLPVGRETVIETVRWHGIGEDYGYRFNSYRVSLVPRQGTAA